MTQVMQAPVDLSESLMLSHARVDSQPGSTPADDSQTRSAPAVACQQTSPAPADSPHLMVLLPSLQKLITDTTGAVSLTVGDRCQLVWHVISFKADEQLQQLALAVEQCNTTFQQAGFSHKDDKIWTLVTQLKKFSSVVGNNPMLTAIAKELETKIQGEVLPEFKNECDIKQLEDGYVTFYKNLNEGVAGFGPPVSEKLIMLDGKPYTTQRALAKIRIAEGLKVVITTDTNGADDDDDYLRVIRAHLRVIRGYDDDDDHLGMIRADETAAQRKARASELKEQVSKQKAQASELKEQVSEQIFWKDMDKQAWFQRSPMCRCLQHAFKFACQTGNWDALDFMMERLVSCEPRLVTGDLFPWTDLPIHVLGAYMTEFEPGKATMMNKNTENFVVRCEKGQHAILSFISQMGTAHTRMQVEVDGIKQLLKMIVVGLASTVWGHVFIHGAGPGCYHAAGGFFPYNNSSLV